MAASVAAVQAASFAADTERERCGMGPLGMVAQRLTVIERLGSVLYHYGGGWIIGTRSVSR